MTMVSQAARTVEIVAPQPVHAAADPALTEIALAYGRAKSEQDLEAAAACITDDFSLAMPALGSRSEGRRGFFEAMRRFYVSFPDYRFVPESVVGDAGSVVLTGRIHATFSGHVDAPGTGGLGILRALGLIRSRAVDVPAVAVLIGRDGLLADEVFHVDGIALAEALGVPSWLVARARRAAMGQGPIV